MKATQTYDLTIIGGGPAGLSSAITGSSERVKSVLLESSERLGGQAGRSSLIENLIGFHEGVTGMDLTSRATAQATKFGTEILCPAVGRSIHKDDKSGLFVVATDEIEVVSKSILLAAGLSYRTLNARNIGGFMGFGVSYGMPTFYPDGEKNKVFIVGGANSAGQAAMNLAKNGSNCEIVILVRGDSLDETMSAYLLDRIKAAGNIEVWTHSEVLEVQGDTKIRSLLIKRDGQEMTVEANGLHIFIGAIPKTIWLKGVVSMDEKGFIPTGYRVRDKSWTLKREPFGYETSVPGIFAVGDVRLGSIKRVATAAGEGAAVIAQMHQYFALPEQD